MTDAGKANGKKKRHLKKVSASRPHAFDPPNDRASSLVDDIYELVAADDLPIARQKRKKIRWRVLVLRLFTYGMSGLALLLLGLFSFVKIKVKPQDVIDLVKAVVEDQTGGRLDIGAAKFNLMTGISFERVEFYPPSTRDTRGYRNRGEIDPIALANFDALDIRYSIPKLFAGFIHVKALQLVAPQFHLRQDDGVWNYDGILAYRRVNFPEDEAARTEALKEKETPSEPTAMPAWLVRYGPALLYLPFEVMAQNIGIKNLTLDLIKQEKGKIAQIVQTSGLTIDVGLHWHGLSSRAWLSMPSPFEHPFELAIQDARRDAEGQLSTDLVQTVKLSTAMISRVELIDLKHLNFDYAMRIAKVETPEASFTDLGAFVKARIDADADYKGFSFQTFNVNLLDAIDFDLSGKVGLPNGTPDVIDLKLEEKLHIDIDSLATLAKPFIPGLKARGELDFKDMWLEGTVEPAKLGQIMIPNSGVQMPWVSAAMWLKNVVVEYPPLQMVMEPINGSVAIAGGPAMGSHGSQIDLTMDMDVPKIEVTQDLGKLGVKGLGDVMAGVQSLVSKMTARVLLPEMTAPIFKLNVEAEHVRVAGKGLKAVDAPLFLDIDADGRKDLQRLSLSANMELEGLAEFSATANCQFKCEKFRASANARMDSLKSLHAIALPLSSLFGLQGVMPTSLGGALDFQLTAKGKLPDPTEAKPDELVGKMMSEGDVRFNSQFNVSKLTAQVPLFKVNLQGFDSRILMSGTLKQQKVELGEKFESLSLELPQKPGQEKPVAVHLSRFSLDTVVSNEIDGILDLKKPLQQLATFFETKMFLGKAEAEGILPMALSDLQVVVKASQTKMSDVRLEELTFKSPDFGTNMTLEAAAKLGDNFMPQAASAHFKTHVSHNGGEKLVSGIKTSGQIDVDVAVETKDMQQIAVQGFTSFDGFNISIDGKEPNGPPLLVIEDMNGQVPFRQTVDLAAILQQLEKKKANAGSKPIAVFPPSGGGVAAAEVSPAAVSETTNEEKAQTEADDEEQLAAAVGTYFEKNNNKVTKNTNVAALLDYGSIRPFFPGRKPLSIKRIEAANLELSKMEFDVELRQNWFAVNQFMINFLGGKIQGDMQLSFDPMPQSIRTSVHMTRLDSRKLIERFPNLKGKATSWNLFSNPYIDGTVHFKYDLKGNDMSGGVEITSIGKEQLRMMLYYVDPYEQNPSIAEIRKALTFGDVRQVSVPIKNGEIDVDVDVRLLGTPLPTPKLTRFPISQLVQNFKDQAAKDAEAASDDQEAAQASDGDVSSDAAVKPEAVINGKAGS